MSSIVEFYARLKVVETLKRVTKVLFCHYYEDHIPQISTKQIQESCMAEWCLCVTTSVRRRVDAKELHQSEEFWSV